MKTFRLADLSLVVKMAVAPAFAVVMLALVAGGAVVSQQQQTKAIDRIVQEDMSVSLELAKISKQVIALHGDLYLAMTHQASNTEGADIPAKLQALMADADSIKAELTTVKAKLSAAEAKRIDPLIKELADYRGGIEVGGALATLLAVAAGVEAARAGDAGKGFAVVASEVRALAQRSAEAAKEIKALISASTTQVGSGAQLVDRTGKALEALVLQVDEIDALVSEIAASAKEQATGLNEVNSAVNSMDQVTQQNAAMVEESSAAAHALKGEAGELARLIGEFRTGDAPPSARPAPRAANSASRPVASAPRRMANKLKSAYGGARRRLGGILGPDLMIRLPRQTFGPAAPDGRAFSCPPKLSRP